MRTLIFTAMALLVVASACDGDGDGDTPPTATSASTRETSAPPQPPLTPPIDETLVARETLTIDQPPEGRRVSIPFEISGTAYAAEDTISVAVIDDAHGGVQCEHHLTVTKREPPAGWSVVMAYHPLPAGTPAAGPREVAIGVTMRSGRDANEFRSMNRAIIVSDEQPSIVITSPRCGEGCLGGTSLIVQGTAASGVAPTIEVRNSGRVLQTQAATVSSAGGERASWETAFDCPVPGGTYEIAAYRVEPDGTVTDEFAIPIDTQG